MTIRIDKVVTSGTFALDGGEWDVDNNIWLIGDDESCYIIDAAHEAEPIIQAVGDRKVLAYCSPTATTTTSPSPRSWPSASTPPSSCTPATTCSGR